MGPLPPWRRDLEVRLRDDGSVDVRDPRLHQVFSLDRSDWLVAQLFDGERDAGAIELMLGQRGWNVSARRVAQIAADYAEIFLLDTPEAKLARPEPESSAPFSNLDAGRRRLRVLPVAEEAARWACHRCGACCHGLAVEITADEEARIDKTLYDDMLVNREFSEHAFIDPDQPARRVLKKRAHDRGCVFLSASGLCAIHERQGAAAKPDACQAFPFLVLHVPKGPPRLGLRVNCESMAKSFEDGSPVASYAESLQEVASSAPSHRIGKELLLFKRVVPFDEVDHLSRVISAELAAGGATARVIQKIDRRWLGGRVARGRRRYGDALLEHLDAESNAEVPVDEGGYQDQVSRLRRGAIALEDMRAGKAPPDVPLPIPAFLAAQAGHVLYMGGPANIPDAGLGLVMTMLALEAALHAVGPRGDLQTANVAFMVFTAPLLEVTTHAWPILDALDRRYARRLRKEV